VTTGAFVNHNKSDIDLLLVVDNLKRTKLKNLISNLEAEVGKELRYMVIDSEEMTYRLNMLDRFLLDIFKNPHEIMINKVPKVNKLISRLEK
jgi:hypothetical protein